MWKTIHSGGYPTALLQKKLCQVSVFFHQMKPKETKAKHELQEDAHLVRNKAGIEKIIISIQKLKPHQSADGAGFIQAFFQLVEYLVELSVYKKSDNPIMLIMNFVEFIKWYRDALLTMWVSLHCIQIFHQSGYVVKTAN